MNVLSENIINIIKTNNFYNINTKLQGEKYYTEINKTTPEGEDWWETIWHNGTDNDFIISIINRANNFDVDDEVEPYVKIRGTNGTPSSIKDLLNDGEWKKEQLIKLANNLNNID